MVKSNEINHEYFEELCALSALGQISREEFEQLQLHLRSCVSCRGRHTEFMEILHEHMPILDPQNELFANSPNIAFHDSSYKQRFIQRALQEGIKIEGATPDQEVPQRLSFPSALPWRLLWPVRPQKYAFALALIVLGIAAGVLGNRWRESQSRNAQRLEVARLNNEIARLELRIGELSKPAGPPRDQLIRPDPLKSKPEVASAQNLEIELSNVRQNYTLAVAKSGILEEQLQKVSSELAMLRQEQVAVNRKDSLSDKVREMETALGRATEELEKLRRTHSMDASTIAAHQAHISELTERLNAQGDALERERELLTAGRDIRDLMGARSLHIIDVTDVDSQGTKRPFGRVFYTEGKSLIFYAYDLEKQRKPQDRYSFQAWGQRESKAGSAQSLGVFFADDQAQSRWILKYDDPNILAEIDAVFVTIEPKGGSMKPRGQQLMYAYLKANPNHP
jgi:hypothetical protein